MTFLCKPERSAGRKGVREWAWEADRTIELKLIGELGFADAIAQHVIATYALHNAAMLYLSDMKALRHARF
jgi:nitrogen regulatory protein P-II 2